MKTLEERLADARILYDASTRNADKAILAGVINGLQERIRTRDIMLKFCPDIKTILGGTRRSAQIRYKDR